MYGFQISKSKTGWSYELQPVSITATYAEADMSKKKLYASLGELPRAEMPKDKRFIDLTGQKFGRLTVGGYAGKAGMKASKWACACACGNFVVVYRAALTSGDTRSCGCYRRELTTLRKTTHGMTHSDIYNIWGGIQDRTGNSRSHDYSSYGGRGIVCEFNNFGEFYFHIITELGGRPSSNHTIDRVNNDGNYAPGNLRWATQSEQGRNKRNNRIVLWENSEMPLVEACELAGRNYQTMYTRITTCGWTPEEALTIPIGQRRPKISKPAPDPFPIQALPQ